MRIPVLPAADPLAARPDALIGVRKHRTGLLRADHGLEVVSGNAPSRRLDRSPSGPAVALRYDCWLRSSREIRLTWTLARLGLRAAEAVAEQLFCGVALSLDVGQALGELAIPDPDDIHAAHVAVSPVVAPAHDGAF